MAVFQDPPIIVDGIDDVARLVDATLALGADEVADLARTDTVVLTGPIADAVALAEQVAGLGPAVVVEVEIPRGVPVDRAPFDDLAAMGLATGLHVTGVADPGDHAATGWELGAVTWALHHGVRTVRGVDPRRLRRLVAVARSLGDEAAP